MFPYFLRMTVLPACPLPAFPPGLLFEPMKNEEMLLKLKCKRGGM